MSPRNRRRVSIALATLLALAGLYFAFMMIASADMAFISCDNHYSLFAPTPRCRVPYIAMILSGVFFILAIAAAVYGRRWRDRIGAGPGGSN
jgi:hypothetical protein